MDKILKLANQSRLDEMCDKFFIGYHSKHYICSIQKNSTVLHTSYGFLSDSFDSSSLRCNRQTITRTKGYLF